MKDNKGAKMVEGKDEIFGYRIEKNPNYDPNDFFGEAAYILHGKKAKYYLKRYGGNSHRMYVVNSNYNTVGIKGNYTFSDRDGDLEVMNNGIHPNDWKKFNSSQPNNL